MVPPTYARFLPLSIPAATRIIRSRLRPALPRTGTSRDDLAEAGQVGPHAEVPLRAAQPDAEGGDHLVEHQEGAEPVAEPPHPRVVGEVDRPRAAFRSHGLDEHAGGAAGQAVGAQDPLERPQVVRGRLPCMPRGRAGDAVRLEALCVRGSSGSRPPGRSIRGRRRRSSPPSSSRGQARHADGRHDGLGPDPSMRNISTEGMCRLISRASFSSNSWNSPVEGPTRFSTSMTWPRTTGSLPPRMVGPPAWRKSI